MTYNSQSPSGHGLSAGYYQDWDTDRVFDPGELWNTRHDAQIDFNWDAGAPMPGMGADGWLTRWGNCSGGERLIGA